MGEKESQLVEVLVDMFSFDELKRFLASAIPESAEDIGPDLPNSSATTRTLAETGVDWIARRGMVDSGFFDHLRRLRPRRANDIYRVARMWPGSSASTGAQYRVLPLEEHRELRYVPRLIDGVDVLTLIGARLTNERVGRRMMVLHGEQGTGKCRIALEWADQQRGRYAVICWVDASRSSVFEGMARYAEIWRLPGYVATGASSDARERLSTNLEIVMRHLALQSERVLIVLVRVSDPQEIQAICPQEGQVDILITMATPLTDGSHSLRIGDMSKEPEAALTLVLQRLGDDELLLPQAEREAARRICNMMGYRPLALAVAAKLLGVVRNPTVLLQMLTPSISGEHLTDTHDRSLEPLVQLYQFFSAAFDMLWHDETSPTGRMACALLASSPYLAANAGISRDLACSMIVELSSALQLTNTSQGATPLSAAYAIGRLRESGLASTSGWTFLGAWSDSLYIHTVVRSAATRWAESTSALQMAHLRHACIRGMIRFAITAAKNESPVLARPDVAPHVMKILQLMELPLREELDADTIAMLDVAFELVEHLRRAAMFRAAEEHTSQLSQLLRGYPIWAARVGLEEGLNEAFRDRPQDYVLARQRYEAAMLTLQETAEKPLNEANKALFTRIQVELDYRWAEAVARRPLGETEDARNQDLRAALQRLEIGRKRLGRSATTSINPLLFSRMLTTSGQVHDALKERRLALEALGEAVKIKRQLLGDRALDVAHTLYWSGLAMRRGLASSEVSSQLEAIAPLAEALQIYSERLGEEHSFTVKAHTALAQTLRRAGRLGEAEKHAVSARVAQERIEGPDSYGYAVALHTEARILLDQALGVSDDGRVGGRMDLLRSARQRFSVSQALFHDEQDRDGATFMSFDIAYIDALLGERGAVQTCLETIAQLEQRLGSQDARLLDYHRRLGELTSRSEVQR